MNWLFRLTGAMTAVLGLLAASNVTCAKAPPDDTGTLDEKQAERKAQADTLEIHEWGLLPIVWSGTRETPALPDFLHTPSGDIPDISKVLHRVNEPGDAPCAEKPVLFFHASKQTFLNLTVTFPQGALSYFYPKPSALGGEPRSSASYFSLVVRPQENDEVDKSVPLAGADLPESHWWQACNKAAGTTEISIESERSRFLFYEGVPRYLPPLTVARGKDGETIFTNQGEHPMRSFCVIARRDGKLYGSWCEELKGDAAGKPEPFAFRAEREIQPEALMAELRAANIKLGLTGGEADAFTTAWTAELTGDKPPLCFFRMDDGELGQVIRLDANGPMATVFKRALYVSVIDAENVGVTLAANMASKDLAAKGKAGFGHLAHMARNKTDANAPDLMGKMLDDLVTQAKR